MRGPWAPLTQSRNRIFSDLLLWAFGAWADPDSKILEQDWIRMWNFWDPLISAACVMTFCNAELNMRNSDIDEVLLNESTVLRAYITRKTAILTLGVKPRLEQFITKTSKETDRFSQAFKLFSTMLVFIKAPDFQRTSKRRVGGCICEKFWTHTNVAARYVKFHAKETTL